MYRVKVVIMAGAALTGRPIMKILATVRPVMATQVHGVQIVITADGAVPTAKPMLLILTTARHVTERI